MKKIFQASVLISAIVGISLCIAPSLKASKNSPFEVLDFLICSNILEQECEGSNSSFANDVKVLFCLTRVKGVRSSAPISHVWYHGDEERARIRLPVRSSGCCPYSSMVIEPNEIGYWRVEILGPDGKKASSVEFRIFPFRASEESQPPLISQKAESAFIPASDFDAIQSIISSWHDAWKRKDADHCASFYSLDFRSGGLDYEGMLEKKTTLYNNPEPITVDISDLEISIRKNRAVARFTQRFQKPGYSDVGRKTLILKKRSLIWKITAEYWRPAETQAGKTVGPGDASVSEEINRKDRDLKKSGETDDIEGFSEEKLIVENIKFHKDKKGLEKVIVNMNRHAIPTLFAVEGDEPRVVIDIHDVTNWDDETVTPVEGRLVKKIRTIFQPEAKKLRIFLDINPASKDCTVKPTYYELDNIYCLEVSDNEAAVPSEQETVPRP